MGILDSLKKVMGSGSEAPETVKGPSRTLRDAGIDPSGLDIDVKVDGTLAVAGRVASQAQCDQICEVLEGMPNVASVENNLLVGMAEPEPAAPEPPEQEAVSAVEQASETEKDATGQTYTVQPGDSLWKIAAEVYGNGSKYMKIFEANRDLLDNPDKIFPGQELKIPGNGD